MIRTAIIKNGMVKGIEVCNLIKSGDPNGKVADGTDMPYWNPYTK